MFYYEILPQNKIFSARETLIYSHISILPIGVLVKISLKGKKTTGLIWQKNKLKPTFKVLPIEEILNETPVLTNWQITLADWLKSHYFCPLDKIIKLFLPKKIRQNHNYRFSKKSMPINQAQKRIKLLNENQNNIFNKIKNSKKNKFLIHGITGSGKTEIYAKLCLEESKKNKQTLILVPEISLTPQAIFQFEESTGLKATVIHSKLTPNQKITAWHNIKKGESKLIIGSRSALFAPFQNLGLCVIDEEHENSYKQDQNPRYHTLEVAEKLLKIIPNLKLVLGSATPRIETKYRYQKTTLSLNSRHGSAQLPNIKIIDLRQEFKNGNNSIFSLELQKAIQTTLNTKSQALLFLNRRGKASSVVCRDCGQKEICKNCDSPMTYHTSQNPRLICHHCGLISSPPTQCKNCGSLNIRQLGIGTQKIEEECLKFFPNARVLRADKDNTKGKEDFEKIYHAFREQKADILIGTQMIAKGLNLPKVNLVGVILADISLNMPDFRTGERNFQLLTQVAGRAGRNGGVSEVFIQTYNPENIYLQLAKEHNYQKLYEQEIKERKILHYPPFGSFAKILIEDPNQQNAQKTASEIFENLRRWKDTTPQIQINRYPAYFEKLKGKFRQIIILHDTMPKKGHLHKILENINKNTMIKSNIKIDINPINND